MPSKDEVQVSAGSGWSFSRWLFLRLVGLVYLCAFLSLWAQVEGLIGSRGILPASDFLHGVHQRAGDRAAWLLPTLVWWDSGDRFLQGLCAAGAASGLLLLFNVAPALAALLAWAMYLSLVNVAQAFMSFQWDMLLLETGLLAVFLAPWKLWPRLRDEPAAPALARWLVWGLLFRLMLGSGAVKLLSGDEVWRSLMALEVHYETQPLPTWIGWYAHQLPEWFQQASVAVMFGIELFLPFLIFVPRWGRLMAFLGFAFLQVLIAATGNYCFFNLLSLALAVSLLQNGAFGRALPPGLRASIEAERPGPGRAHRVCALVAGSAILVLSLCQAAGQGLGWNRLPGPAIQLLRWAHPLRSVNSYGLFAVMTTTRQEIVVEGSEDGVEWREYPFRWKPGDLRRAPGFVAPHQPRLDWQMWFAALGRYEDNPWFQRFLVELLRGSKPVLALLEGNPFPRAPPRFVRARLFQYRFTDLNTRRQDGSWWRREDRGLYCPPIFLKEGPP